jgi:hypothetical protein
VVLLNAPQAPVPVLPQVTDQVTPAVIESFAIVAVSTAVPLGKSEVGAPVSVTEMTGGGEVVVPPPPPPHATIAPTSPAISTAGENFANIRMGFVKRLRMDPSLLPCSAYPELGFRSESPEGRKGTIRRKSRPSLEGTSCDAMETIVQLCFPHGLMSM